MNKKVTLLMPIARQFTVVLAVFTLSAIGITLYNTFAYDNLQTAFLNNSLDNYASRLATSTRDAYNSYENICYNVAYSQTVQDYLRSPNSRTAYENHLILKEYLSNIALLNAYIEDVAVYGQNGIFAALNGSAANYQEYAHSSSDSRFPFRSAGVSTINGTLCHILELPIYSMKTGESRYLGILFLAIDLNSLLGTDLDAYQSNFDPKIILTDGEEELVHGEWLLYDSLRQVNAERSVEEFQVLSENDAVTGYVVRSYAISNINHTLYVLINKSQITEQVQRISYQLIGGMSLLILLALFLLVLLYRPLIRSLKQLTDFMHKISSGDRKAMKDGAQIHQGLIGSREIQAISDAFNNMLIQTNHLNHEIFNTYTRMFELENNNRKTEIAFLQSQVNPHFLYNTLTMICGMASEGKTDKIISVTEALSQIFRYSIKANDMVTLEEEMEIVQSYLTIQEERFDRFTVRYDFSEDSLDCMIPKMIIQPLVENAIIHGLEKKLTAGELLIGAGRNPEHGYLAIWIFDTGVGMSPEKLQMLRLAVSQTTFQDGEASARNLGHSDSRIGGSLGILNVNSRMVLYYGTDFTLLIDSEVGVGTNIQLRIPYRTSQSQPS